MLRLVLLLAVVLLYFNTPVALAGAVDQIGAYKDYAFALWIAVLLTPIISPWFD